MAPSRPSSPTAASAVGAPTAAATTVPATSSDTGSGSTSLYNIEKLRGPDNFFVWKMRMTYILKDLKLWNHVEPGTRPASVPESTWEDADQRALTAIALRLDMGASLDIVGATTAKDAWDLLCGANQPTTRAHRIELRRRLYFARMSDDDDVNEHVLWGTLTGRYSSSPPPFTKAIAPIFFFFSCISVYYYYMRLQVDQRRSTCPYVLAHASRLLLPTRLQK